MGTIKEPSASVEIGGYVYQNNGKATAKLQVSDVNKPLVLDNAAITKRLKKVKVTMNVEEDDTPYNNQVYQKDVTMWQTVDDEESPKGTTASAQIKHSPKYDVDDEDEEPKGPLDRLGVLKNFVDNIAEDVRDLRSSTDDKLTELGKKVDGNFVVFWVCTAILVAAVAIVYGKLFF